jgi:hypothetical protein
MTRDLPLYWHVLSWGTFGISVVGGIFAAGHVLSEPEAAVKVMFCVPLSIFSFVTFFVGEMIGKVYGWVEDD